MTNDTQKFNQFVSEAEAGHVVDAILEDNNIFSSVWFKVAGQRTATRVDYVHNSPFQVERRYELIRRSA